LRARRIANRAAAFVDVPRNTTLVPQVNQLREQFGLERLSGEPR
jgi:hypothetical protein